MDVTFSKRADTTEPKQQQLHTGFSYDKQEHSFGLVSVLFYFHHLNLFIEIKGTVSRDFLFNLKEQHIQPIKKLGKCNKNRIWLVKEL
jgi:hypothetical protein